MVLRKWYLLTIISTQLSLLHANSNDEILQVVAQTGVRQNAASQDILDASLIVNGIIKLMVGSLLSAKQHSFAQGGQVMLDGIESIVQAMTKGQPLTAEHIQQAKNLINSLDTTTQQELFAAMWQEIVEEVVMTDQLTECGINQISTELEIVI